MIIPLTCFTSFIAGETEAFYNASIAPTPVEIFATIAKNWRIITAGTLLVAMTTITFLYFLITVYTPTYGRNPVLNLSADSLIVTMLVGCPLIWLPIGGAISTDWLSRRVVALRCWR